MTEHLSKRCSLGLHNWELLPSRARVCARCGRAEMMFYDTWEAAELREAYGTLKSGVTYNLPKGSTPTKRLISEPHANRRAGSS